MCCSSLNAQVQGDSLAVKKDTLLVKKDSLLSQNDMLPFNPAYRRGVKYLVKTTVGTTYSGFIISETRQFITIENKNTHETTELRKSAIVSALVLSGQQNFESDFTGENMYASNYMFATSAFPFKKEKVSFDCHWLLLANLDYAFTDNWAITMNSLTFYPVTLGIKCAYKLDDMNYIGGNIFAMGNISIQTTSPFWGYGAFAKFTRGTSNQNFTLSGGLLGLNSKIFYNAPKSAFFNVPFANLGYCSRLTQKIALVLEGWYIPDFRTAFAGVGIKLVNNEENCWTFGCYGILNNFNTSKIHPDVKAVPIPYISLSQKF